MNIECADCKTPLSVTADPTGLVRPERFAILCDTCVAARDVDRHAEEQRQALRRRFARAVASGVVSEETRAATFRSLDADICERNAEAWDQAHRWTVKGHNLYLYGTPGTGKTLLARCLLRRAFTQGYDIAETNGRRLMKIAARFDEGRGMFRTWERADVLLLDDLDKVQATADGVSALWELLDTRCNGGRRTLVTANVPLSELVQQLGRTAAPATVAAAMDRLSPLTAIKMAGESAR